MLFPFIWEDINIVVNSVGNLTGLVAMKKNEINMRDPFVLVHEGKYYLYGTNGKTCWGKADNFDCYISEDLKDFDGPIRIFDQPDNFFADRSYWAPECHSYQGAFYLVTTLGGPDRKKGIYILRSESPAGPFTLWSEQLTPERWTCIDGTLHVENGTPWLVFSHTFEDGNFDGDFCTMPLMQDLKQRA